MSQVLSIPVPARPLVEVAGRADERTRRVTSAIARGGMAAFDEFYAEWFDFAYETARHVTGRDEAMCLDIVQEAMLRVARTIRPMRTEDDVRRWLVRVVHTTALDELRRERRRRGRERVRAIQKRLADRGYYSGLLDGSLGPKTHEAIQTYQRVQRYDVTGRPSRAIYEELEDYALDVQGLDHFRNGAYDAAVATYTRIIRRKPKNADAYFNRGLAYKNDGRTGQALTDYRAAIELDPAHRKAYFDRANILYDQGLYRDALGAYFKALKLLLSIG